MITKLTDAQIARMPEFRDKWIRIGLDTSPANRPEAEKGIFMAYAAAGLPPPKKIVWCGSPFSQGLTRAIIIDKKLMASVGDSVWASVRDSVWASVRDSVGDSVGASVRDSVGDSVWDSVRASVWASVGASVGDSVGASVRDSVGDSVWASVWDSVGDSVWASVRASVGDSVWASVRDSVRDSVGDSVGASVRDSVGASVRDSVGDSVYGQHDANWLSFYEFFREACGLAAQTDKLSGLTLQAKNAGWFLPHANICWVSERHSILHRDERGRLHNLVGPAVAYPDGWAIYAVHGVRVPCDVIENPSSITVGRIDRESNAEVRRVMIERYGQSKYLLDGEAKEISSDDYGVLYRKEIAGDEPLVMVKVVNSTAEPDGSFKDYFIRVPPIVTKPREAIAWTFGKTESEYAPSIQT